MSILQPTFMAKNYYGYMKGILIVNALWFYAEFILAEWFYV